MPALFGARRALLATKTGDDMGYDMKFLGPGLTAMSAEGAAVGSVAHNIPGGTLSVFNDSNFRFKISEGGAIVAGKCFTRPELLGSSVLRPVFRVARPDGTLALEKQLTIPILPSVTAPGVITLTGPWGTGAAVIPAGAPAGTWFARIAGRISPYSRLTVVNTAGGQIEAKIDLMGHIRVDALTALAGQTVNFTVREEFGGNQRDTPFAVLVAAVTAPSGLAWDGGALSLSVSASRGPVNPVRTLTWTAVGPVDVTLDNGLDCGFRILQTGEGSAILYPYGVMPLGPHTLTGRVKSLITNVSTPIDLAVTNTPFNIASLPQVKAILDPTQGVTTGSRIIPSALAVTSGITLSYGNRTALSAASPGYCESVGVIADTQRVFIEIHALAMGTNSTHVQIGLKDATYMGAGHASTDWGSDAHGLRWTNDGAVKFNNANVITGAAFVNGDKLYLDVDRVNGTVKVAVNNGAFSAAGSIAGWSGDVKFAAQLGSATGKIFANLGQQAFARAVPSGARAGLGVDDPNSETIVTSIIDQASGVTFAQTMGPALVTDSGHTYFSFKSDQRLVCRGSNVVTAIGMRAGAVNNGLGAENAWMMVVGKFKRSSPGVILRTENETAGVAPADRNLRVQMTAAGVVQTGNASSNLDTLPDDTWTQHLVEINRTAATANIRGRHDGLVPSALTGASTAAGTSTTQNLLSIGATQDAAGQEFLAERIVIGKGDLSDSEIAALRSALWSVRNTPTQSGEDLSSAGPNVIDLRNYLLDVTGTDRFTGAKLNVKSPATGQNGMWTPTMPIGQANGGGGAQVNQLYGSWDADPRAAAVANLVNTFVPLPGGRLAQFCLKAWAEHYDVIGGDGGVGGFPAIPGQSMFGGVFQPPRYWPRIGSMMQTQDSHCLDFGFREQLVWLDKAALFWPAFWTLFVGGEWPPEFDIFEVFGLNSNGRMDQAHHSTLRPGATARTGDVAFSATPSSDPNTQQNAHWQDYSVNPDSGAPVWVGARFDPQFGLGAYFNGVFVGYIKQLPGDMLVPSFILSNADTAREGSFVAGTEAATPDFLRKINGPICSYRKVVAPYVVPGGTDADATAYIASLAVAPSAGDQTKIHTFVKEAKVAVGFDLKRPTLSIWDLLDLTQLLKFGPQSLKGATTFSGLTVTPGVGAIGAAGQVGDTGYVPHGKGAGHADIIDQHMFVWLTSTPNNKKIMGLGNGVAGTDAKAVFLDATNQKVGLHVNGTRTDRDATGPLSAAPNVGNGGLYGWTTYPARGTAGADNIVWRNARHLSGKGHRRTATEYVALDTMKILDDCAGSNALACGLARDPGMQGMEKLYELLTAVLS